MKQFAIASMMVVSFVLVPVSAFSQDEHKGPPTARTDSELKNDAAIEKAYKDTLKRMGDSGTPVKADPWQDVRPTVTDSKKH